jgi:4a-hydroxytetrahydrobiopterin dehydratase
MSRDPLLDPDEVAALDVLTEWRVVEHSLVATFRADSFTTGGHLVAAIAAAADAADHHPDVDLRFPGLVHVLLTTHDSGGLTRRDVEVAGTVSALAARVGATAVQP